MSSSAKFNKSVFDKRIWKTLLSVFYPHILFASFEVRIKECSNIYWEIIGMHFRYQESMEYGIQSFW